MMEQLQTALSALKVLRSSVGEVFYCLANGIRADHGEDSSKENKYLFEIQELLTTVGTNLRDVEQSVNSLSPAPGPFNLGNTAYLGQETTQDRQALYSTLVNVYKWTDKAHEYSNVAHQILSQNSLKRSSMNTNRAKRNRQPGAHTFSPQQVDQVLNSFDRMYNDMSFQITRPYTSNAVVHVTLAHVFKATIAFKGLMMERVVVKGYNEELDLWSESRYKVFQRVTDHAHSTMLHFYNPNFPELALKSFFAWFHSYISLFSDACKRCGLYLHGALPPTWRDPKSLDSYHFECKS